MFPWQDVWMESVYSVTYKTNWTESPQPLTGCRATTYCSGILFGLKTGRSEMRAFNFFGCFYVTIFIFSISTLLKIRIFICLNKHISALKYWNKPPQLLPTSALPLSRESTYGF